MDSSRRKKPRSSLDGFIPSRKSTAFSRPFEKIKNAKIESSARIIPKRKPISLGGYNEEITLRSSHARVNIDDKTLGTSVSNIVPEDNKHLHISSRRQRRQQKHAAESKRKSRIKKTIKYSSFLIILCVLIAFGFLGVKIVHNVDKVFGGNIVSNISSLFSSTVPLKGESTGRVNILLAGDSSDDPGHDGAVLTDSILIISIDTKNHTAFMLSIPRDLWVNIPGWSWQKINAANAAYGTNFPGYPQNGMGQLEHIIVTDLGIPINYYALSDYGAFKDAVNAVGGVSVDITSPDPRGLYDPNADLNLPNGIVNLNGQEALNLARARGDGYGSYGFTSSDFDRTTHQRLLFTAIAKKAKSVGVLTNPVKIGDLFNAFGNNIKTDLTLQNVLRLVQISKGIDLNNVKSYAYCSTLSLGTNGCTSAILTDYTDPASGEEAIIPEAGIGDYSQLIDYYNSLITTPTTSTTSSNSTN
jgi:LCP family protein required for cell wall assembly